MARLYSDNFGINSTTVNLNTWDTYAGGTLSTTTFRTGVRSGRISSLASGTAQGWLKKWDGTTRTGPFWLRTYLYVHVRPSAANHIISMNGASGSVGSTPRGMIKLNSDGTLTLHDSAGTQIGSASAALTLDTWYMVELKVDHSPASGSRITEGRLNGGIFATSSSQTDGNVFAFSVGGNLNSEAQTTGDWFFADIAINDNTGTYQNSYPGSEKVLYLPVSGAGDANGWGDTSNAAGSTNNYTLVDENPPNDATDMVQSGTLNAEDLYAVTDSGIATADIVNAVLVGGRFRNNTSDATTAFKFEIEKTTGGTKTQSAAIIPNTTTWNTNGTAVPRNYPLVAHQDPDGAFWTLSTLDSMQIGQKITAANVNRIQVSAIWAVVGYTPSTIQLDSVTSGKSTGGTTSLTINAVVGSGSNQKLIIAMAVQDSNQNAQTITVTVDGVAATKSVTGNNAAGDRTELWYKDGLSAGTKSVVITSSGSVNTLQGCVTSLFNAASGAPEATANTSTGGATNLSTTITTVTAGAWIIDAIEAEDVPTPTGGQTQRWTQQSQSFQNGKGSSIVAVDVNTYTVGYKIASSQAAALCMIAVAPFTGGGSSSIKTINGLAVASVKTVNGLAIASVKNWDGLA